MHIVTVLHRIALALDHRDLNRQLAGQRIDVLDWPCLSASVHPYDRWLTPSVGETEYKFGSSYSRPEMELRVLTDPSIHLFRKAFILPGNVRVAMSVDASPKADTRFQ